MTRKPALLIPAIMYLALCCGPALAQEPEASPVPHAEKPPVQQPKASPARWESNIQQFEASDRENPPPKGAVLFVGSSSIRMWKSLEKDFPGTPVINRGFGGSQIEDSLHFADRIILPYAPRLVVVYAGDNDLAHGKTPARLLADYQKLVARIHEGLPETRIAYIAIKPSRARAHLLPQIERANDLIRHFSCEDKRLAFIDVFRPMLTLDGTPRDELFLPDGLHLNPQGYALWKAIVKPYLE